MKFLAGLGLSMAMIASVHAAPKPAPVVLLGASMIQFWTDTDPDFFAAHPNYVDLGHAGEPLSNTVARAPREAMPLKPKVVFVLANAGTDASSPARMLRQLSALNALTRKQSARLVVAGSPTARPETLRMIRDYAQSEGVVHVDFAEMRDADGRVKPGLTYDGVHPTAAGYALMEPRLVAGVDQALATP